MLIDGLSKKYEAEIAAAKANIDVYNKNPAGIGEHSDIMGAIEEELNMIAKYQDQIDVIQRYLK